MVGSVAGAQAELAYPVCQCGLLKGIRLFLFKNHRSDDSFHILAPKLWALFMSLVESYLFGHADNLHGLQHDDFVSHIFLSFIFWSAKVEPFAVAKV